MDEKKKLKVSLCLIFLFICIAIIILYFSTLLEKRANEDVYEAIMASKINSQYENILLGDSVSRQIFNVYNQKEDEKFYHLNSNQAIGVIGNYILLKNYLKQNTKVRNIYYIVRPWSLTNNLNQPYTYGYFVLPFLSEEENFKYVPKPILKRWQEAKKYYKYFFYKNTIKILEKNPNFILKILKINLEDSNFKISQEQAYLSEMSVIYLKEIEKLCKEYGINFKLISSPLSSKYKYENFSKLKNEVNKYGLARIFNDYFHSIDYYPEDKFRDEVHFEKEFLEQNIVELQENMYKKFK